MQQYSPLFTASHTKTTTKNVFLGPCMFRWGQQKHSLSCWNRLLLLHLLLDYLPRDFLKQWCWIQKTNWYSAVFEGEVASAGSLVLWVWLWCPSDPQCGLSSRQIINEYLRAWLMKDDIYRTNSLYFESGESQVLPDWLCLWLNPLKELQIQRAGHRAHLDKTFQTPSQRPWSHWGFFFCNFFF